MKQSYREMYRVLKPGRFCVIIIGNASFGGEEIKTVEFTIEYCENLGFKLVKNLHKIIFGLYNVMQKVLWRLYYGFRPATSFSY
jgi:hypothetical protein